MPGIALTMMIYPMIAMFSLTLFVLILLFKARVTSVAKRQVRASYFLTYASGGPEPAHSVALSQNFKNLFEAPVLFYVVCLVVLITGAESLYLPILAWGYVLTRGLHTFIHIGSNNLHWRIGAYMASWLCLTGLWAGLALEIQPI